MSTSTLSLFLRQLALNEEVSRLATTSDRTLLAACESGSSQAVFSQAAFTELMRRHGPMVLRTCRRVLKRETDAEDALQATFIFLARQAGSISKREALGGWLHRVAYRTALQVLRRAVRRKAHERQASAMSHAELDPLTKVSWNEIWPILDAELDALPDEARRLLIAFYLEEKTYTEVTAELGLPRSSVAWRLEKARGLLAARLARRGITVTAAVVGVLLEESAKGAVVPAVLQVHTVEAARTFTEQATGVVSDNVARLVKGELTRMTIGWTYWSMALVGWLGLLGAGLLACHTLNSLPGQPPKSSPLVPAERPAQERSEFVRTDLYGDPVPFGALARLGTTRLRHADGVSQVLFAPDGRMIASGGMDDTVRLWDAATGKLVRSQKQPGGIFPFPLLSFAQDGKTLTSLADNQIWLWDVSKGQLLRETKLKLESNQQVVLLAISPDGKIAASWGADTVAQLWDVASGYPLRALTAC